MEDKIVECFLLHLCNIRRDSHYVFCTKDRASPRLQQAAEEILHIVKMCDHAVSHRKDNPDIHRRFLKDFIGLVPYGKYIFFVFHCYGVFLTPYLVLLFIKNLDLIRTEIEAINFSRHSKTTPYQFTSTVSSLSAERTPFLSD